MGRKSHVVFSGETKKVSRADLGFIRDRLRCFLMDENRAGYVDDLLEEDGDSKQNSPLRYYLEGGEDCYFLETQLGLTLDDNDIAIEKFLEFTVLDDQYKNILLFTASCDTGRLMRIHLFTDDVATIKPALALLVDAG